MTFEEYTVLKDTLGEPLYSVHIKVGIIDQYQALWQPVYDRTLADCVYGNPRGCLDASCFNRIEYNMQCVNYLLETLGIQWWAFLHEPVLRTFYLKCNIWNDLKHSVINIREALHTTLLLPEANMSVDDEPIDYIQINAIEEILWKVFSYLVEQLIPHQYAVNDMYSGEYLIGGGE